MTVLYISGYVIENSLLLEKDAFICATNMGNIRMN